MAASLPVTKAAAALAGYRAAHLAFCFVLHTGRSPCPVRALGWNHLFDAHSATDGRRHNDSTVGVVLNGTVVSTALQLHVGLKCNLIRAYLLFDSYTVTNPLLLREAPCVRAWTVFAGKRPP